MRRKLNPGPPVNKDILAMSRREKGRLGVQTLPGDLSEAVRAFEKERFLQGAIGSYISSHMVRAKRLEWQK
jgi:glutamine synthetase